MLDGIAIQEKIPHRYPFFLLDGVVEQSPERIVGFKNVTVNEPHFQGHFPNAPVMPGVLVLEALLQLAWVKFAAEGGIRLARIRKLRFRRPTVPGDRLELEVDIVSRDGDSAELKVLARVEDQVSATGSVWVKVGREVVGA
ncbi:MAG: 3-hydroxyacyl-ACP dehydratase FabZ [Vulcanimicrobiota bacterium]